MGDPDSATSSEAPSRESRMPRGRLPTAIRSTTWPLAGSTTTIAPPVSSDTYSRGPLGGAGAGAEAGGVVAAGGGASPEQPAVIRARTAAATIRTVCVPS